MQKLVELFAIFAIFALSCIAVQADPQFFGLTQDLQSGVLGLTRVQLSPPSTSSDFWPIEQAAMYGGYGAITGPAVVSLSDGVLYSMFTQQYWYAAVNRFSLKTRTLLPPVTANIADSYPIDPLSPASLIVDKSKLIALLTPNNGNTDKKPYKIVTFDLTTKLPTYTYVDANFTTMYPNDGKTAYYNGQFVVSVSYDPQIQFTLIDATSGAVTSTTPYMNCGGSALSFAQFGNYLLGFSSHYFSTNNNQMFAFKVDLAANTCTSQKLPLPLGFFPQTFVIPNATTGYFRNFQDNLLYTWNFETNVLTNAAFSGFKVNTILMAN
jgi:hypothetical protein